MKTSSGIHQSPRKSSAAVLANGFTPVQRPPIVDYQDVAPPQAVLLRRYGRKTGSDHLKGNVTPRIDRFDTLVIVTQEALISWDGSRVERFPPIPDQQWRAL
jgi:hypothetical protein